MFKNYLTTAFRNLFKHKGYSLINIIGLAVGIMAFIMIMLYVQYELSYDTYHSKSDRIYRVSTHGSLAGNDFDMAISPAPVGAAFQREIPGVIASARTTNLGFPVIRYDEKVFSEERWFTVDSTFFDVFDVEFIQGDPKTALTQPMRVVLTRSTAKRYFGNDDPMGKTLNSDHRRDYVVTGVIEDCPENSHFHYDFLASVLSYPQMANSQLWVNNNFYTYLVLDEFATSEEVESFFPGMVDKYAGPQVQQFMGVSWEKLTEQGASYGFRLQPLTDIHLHSDLEYEPESNGNALYIQIFLIIAIFVLIIACINFMNLATARSAKRAREVGVRKTLGSTRGQLMQQFLIEAILLTTIAVILAVVLVALLLQPYNNLLVTQLSFNLLSSPWTIPTLILLILAVGLISGSYPAFYLASFNPVKVLKGSAQAKNSKSWLRSGLVIFQFTISITLFTGTMIVFNQLNYIQDKDLGYTKSDIVIVEKTDDIGQQIEAFKNDLRQDPRILSVSNSTGLIGHNFGNSTHQIQGEPAENTILLSNFFTDDYYANAYKLKLKEGRFFSPDRPNDSLSVVINETAAEYMNIGDPIGRYLMRPAGPNGEMINVEIVGIVKDFHFQSMHEKIRPLTIYHFNSRGFGRYTAVQITRQDIPGTLNYIEEIWKKYAVDQPFEYTFLDDDFNQLYIAEERTKNIATIFSLLAILIACLGLFGLASFTAEQRTKEIGIRKVLGASVSNIYTLLSADILKLILIATALSWPITYMTMSRWLENFAYQIEFSHLTFLLAGLLAFIIALATVTTQAVKAATSNPVDALKYE